MSTSDGLGHSELEYSFVLSLVGASIYYSDLQLISGRITRTKDVTTIFDQQPPEPEKQVKDFRALTHDFEKAVISLQSPPEPE